MNHNTTRGKTLAIAALTAGALAVAAMGSVPTANATCASFFGLGSGGQCTSTLTSIAIAIGTNAEAHAEGMLGAALTLGDSSTAGTAAGALLNVAVTLGNGNLTSAGGLGSVAFAGDGIDQAVVAGVGTFTEGSIGNIAVSLASPAATATAAAGIANLSVNLAGSGTIIGVGTGLATVNVIGLSTNLDNAGVLNNTTNLSGNNNSITVARGSFGNLGFNLIGSDNVITTDGVLAIGGAIGSVGQTVSQSGPGVNVSVRRGLPVAAASAAAPKPTHARTARRSS
ncbi:MAG: hypothetical protein ACOYEV_18985 [Candidatus Nanopelagicales bacterium]